MNFWRHWWVIFFPTLCFLQGVVKNHVNYLTLIIFENHLPLQRRRRRTSKDALFYVFQTQHQQVCYREFFSVTTNAEPKVCFLQTLNAEPIQIDVTHSLVSSPKLRPPSPKPLTTPCPYREQVSFCFFAFFQIIYSNLFCVYLLSATV